MSCKSILMICLLVAAAAEGRSRGSKLGRQGRQTPVWGRQNYHQTQNYQTPQTYQTNYQSNPETNQGYNNAPAPAPTNQGYNNAPAPAPASTTTKPFVVEGPGSKVPSSLCKYPGFFPTPGSCVNFYRCVDFAGTGAYFTVFQFNCPAGTIFDDELDTCNHIAWTVGKRPECIDMMQGSHLQTTTEGAITQRPTGYTTTKRPVTYPSTNLPTSPSTQSPTSPSTQFSTTQSPAVTGGGGYPQPGGATNDTDSGSDMTKFVFECHTDGKYRMHPLYCNKYYKCEFDGSDWVFPKLTCPKDLVFDESDQKCVTQDIKECKGEMAPLAEGLTTEEPATTEMDTEEPTTPTADSLVDPSSLYACPAKGYYPFDGDCIRFFKCVTLESGLLKGLLYRCPTGYGYSEEKKRCDADSRLPTCDKTPTEAHLRMAPGRQLEVEELAWFFIN